MRHEDNGASPLDLNYRTIAEAHGSGDVLVELGEDGGDAGHVV
jgi:hypothetical protein